MIYYADLFCLASQFCSLYFLIPRLLSSSFYDKWITYEHLESGAVLKIYISKVRHMDTPKVSIGHTDGKIYHILYHIDKKFQYRLNISALLQNIYMSNKVITKNMI